MEKIELQASLNRLDIWLIVFGLIVAIGTVGGSIAGYLRWSKNNQLQTIIEAENLETQKVIASANANAAQANLELARMKAPRTLSEEQRERVISVLKPFAETQFDIGLVQGDPEATEFMTVIEVVLQKAGWKQVDWNGGDIVMTRRDKPILGVVTTANVAVITHPMTAYVIENAAAAFSEALSAVNITVVNGTDKAAYVNNNENTVHILVGRKT
jgi:hypothetical protein